MPTARAAASTRPPRATVRCATVTSRLIAQPLDVLGINYYTGIRIAAGPRGGRDVRGRPGAEPSAGPHGDGLGGPARRAARLPAAAHRDYAPRSIMITENGASYSDGPARMVGCGTCAAPATSTTTSPQRSTHGTPASRRGTPHVEPARQPRVDAGLRAALRHRLGRPHDAARASSRTAAGGCATRSPRAASPRSGARLTSLISAARGRSRRRRSGSSRSGRRRRCARRAAARRPARSA
jgi:hypothetical protein